MSDRSDFSDEHDAFWRLEEVPPVGEPAARVMPGGGPKAQSARTPLRAKRFVWKDPETIAPREWVYGRHLIRRYASATVAPGGAGKSTVTIADALAMVSGRNLVGHRPHAQARVWIWNGEDPSDELERRVAAAAVYFGVSHAELEERLFLDSGRDSPIRIAEVANGTIKIAVPIVEALEAAIREAGIDVLILDPFISTHSVPENDNGAIDAVVKEFAGVAHRTGCAIDLVHHVRKLNGAEAGIDDARGGSAIAAAVRAARVLNVMTPETATSLGISQDDRRSYVRIDDAKSNLAPPSAAKWVHLVSVPLGNAIDGRPEDFVAVAEPWSPPDPMEGIGLGDLLNVQRAIDGRQLRENAQAAEWVGHCIGPILGLDSRNDPDKSKIKRALRAWLASGALRVVEITDEKGKKRPIVEVGEWASAP